MRRLIPSARWLVDQNREDHDQALDQHLHERRDFEQVQQIAGDAEDQDRGDGAGDRAAPAGKRRAAEHHRDDRVQLVPDAGVRIAGAEATGEQDARRCPRSGRRA